MAKQKFSKEEQNQNKRHEKKMRREVEKLKAVDELGGKGSNEISTALEKARKYFKALKEARGESYSKDDIKEIKISGDKASGNNKKSK